MKKAFFSRKQDRKLNKQQLASIASQNDLNHFDDYHYGVGGIHPEDVQRLREQERKLSLKGKKSHSND